MINQSLLPDLLRRVKEATGGDRELDRMIARQFGWHRVEPRFAWAKRGGWIAPEDFMGVESDGRPRLDSLHGTTVWPDVPPFTSSLDAALGLCERVLPGWWWAVGHYGPNGISTANISPDGKKHGPDIECATPPLALLAAMLTALSNTRDDGAIAEGEGGQP